MKYVKKFEGRKAKTPVTQTEEEILADYKDRCEDLDDKSYITFDEFFESLDFDIFSKHDYEKFSGAGIYAARIKGGSTSSSRWRSAFVGSFEINIKGRRWNFFNTVECGPICPTGLENSMDWKKRNVFFYAEVNTGGASGGSCYDTGEDDGAQPYYGNSLDLNDFLFSYLKPILNNILASHAN